MLLQVDVHSRHLEQHADHSAVPKQLAIMRAVMACEWISMVVVNGEAYGGPSNRWVDGKELVDAVSESTEGTHLVERSSSCSRWASPLRAMANRSTCDSSRNTMAACSAAGTRQLPSSRASNGPASSMAGLTACCGDKQVPPSRTSSSCNSVQDRSTGMLSHHETGSQTIPPPSMAFPRNSNASTTHFFFG